MEQDVRGPVLIVEDDPITRDALRLFLEKNGLDVEVAADGGEAFDHLRAHGAPCLILLDLTMPGMDGWEFMDTLARHPTWIGVPVLLLTGAGDISREEALAMGADELLRKPVDPQALVEVIEHYC